MAFGRFKSFGKRILASFRDLFEDVVRFVTKDQVARIDKVTPQANPAPSAPSPSGGGNIYNEAKIKFNQAKQLLLREVREHPICEELSTRPNNSRFLGGAAGTLYGFLGFEDGQEPVEDLLDFLAANILFQINRPTAIGVFPTTVLIPSLEDIESEGSLSIPWDSRPWPIAVEEGISGLPHYLFLEEKGRSLEGIQAKDRRGNLIKIRSQDFKPVPFLKPIFARFRKRLAQ